MKTRWMIGAWWLAAGLVAAEPVSLAGAIDFHCHTGPDTGARSHNSLEAVRLARAAGLRGLVLKHHFMPTSALAQLATEELGGGIELFGGVVLNRAAGGLNAEAVRRMAQVTGKRGRVVWLPTFDAEHQVRLTKETRPGVAVLRDGRPVLELLDVFKAVAESDLVLATGHSSPEESLVILAAAREAGVRRLLVTHAITPRWRLSLEQMKRAAALGAVMELIWHNHMMPPPGTGRSPAAAPMPIAVAADAIRAVGAQHFLISSDLGQAGNPPHAGGLRAFAAALRGAGLDDRAIDLMLRKNPARLLGLEP